MDTGAFDTLLAATDPFNDSRNAVGIDIAAGLARLHIMINEMTKTELGLAKHEFAEKYAALCISFAVEYAMASCARQRRQDARAMSERAAMWLSFSAARRSSNSSTNSARNTFHDLSVTAASSQARAATLATA